MGGSSGLGVWLGFAYILFLKFSQMFVFTGTMTPMVALWLPNVLFTIVAAFIYRKASK